MRETDILRLKVTTSAVVGTAGYVYPVAAYTRNVRIQAAINTHLAVYPEDGEAPNADSTNDCPLAADTPITVHLDAGDILNIAKGAGETDGQVWITEVDVL